MEECAHMKARLLGRLSVRSADGARATRGAALPKAGEACGGFEAADTDIGGKTIRGVSLHRTGSQTGLADAADAG